MARVLQFHEPSLPGYRVPGYPNVHHDADMLAAEARLRGVSEDDYVAELLTYKWPDGKPAFTLGAAGREDFSAAAAAQAEATGEERQAAAAKPAEAPTRNR
jgi:hypothetical protein